MIEKLYTVEEVAELASVTGRTIRNYLKNGRLVGRKIGGQWRFPESEVQRLLTGSDEERPTEQSIAPAAETQAAQAPPQEDNSDENEDFFTPLDDIVSSHTDYLQNENIEQQNAPVQETAFPQPAAQTPPPAEQPLYQPALQQQVYAQPQAQSPAAQPSAPQHSATYNEPGLAGYLPADYPQQNYANAPKYQHSAFQNMPQNEPAPVYSGYQTPPERITPLPKTYPPPPPQDNGGYEPYHGTEPSPYRGFAGLPKIEYPQPSEHPYTPPAPLFYGDDYYGANTNAAAFYGNLPPQQNEKPARAPQGVFPSYGEPEIPPQPQIKTEPQPVQQAPLSNDATPETKTEPQKEPNAFNYDALSDVGKKAAEFSSQIHVSSSSGEGCSVVDICQSLNSAKNNIDNLQKIIEAEKKKDAACDVYLEFDERFSVARYTIFGSLDFTKKCLQALN